MFLSTLHDSMVGLIKSQHKLVDLIGSLNTYKLVGGLRCLLARSILMKPKFSVTDIERTISSYFPHYQSNLATINTGRAGLRFLK